MAGNDWRNSYLEAILDVAPGIDEAKSSLRLREGGQFTPTRYFVEEVITGLDETDLYRSWVRAQATRPPQERNTRLENMCWRVWNLARQRKQLEGEEARRNAKRRQEREIGRREAVANMSEDLSEGEKGDLVGDLLVANINICSDKPGQHDFNLLEKLALPDRSILRPTLPGCPTRDCLFSGLPRVASNNWKPYVVVYCHRHGDLVYLPKDTSLPIALKAREYQMFNSGGPIKEVKEVGTVDMKARGCGLSGANSSAGPKRREGDAEEVELVVKNYQIGIIIPLFLGAGPVKRIKSRIPEFKIIFKYGLNKFYLRFKYIYNRNPNN